MNIIWGYVAGFFGALIVFGYLRMMLPTVPEWQIEYEKRFSWRVSILSMVVVDLLVTVIWLLRMWL